ncbi:YidH family protein [Desulfovibrio sp. Fe33]|uniref:YidH family protein n=1 Tax=Desulfovibrio sp. Fe33 TaxID=3020842 RepID=UPI00234D1D31|nr:DUF202 domain-containing protein [Desulfovibrio sp. Fe33]
MSERNGEGEGVRLARERNALAVDRTRLANRRTFLAWCRTSLAFMTFGFLLEKVDAFLAFQKSDVSAGALAELGWLGKFAFVGGPVLMIFAAWRFYRLEKELGLDKGDLCVIPELILFSVIMASAVIYLFL